LAFKEKDRRPFVAFGGGQEEVAPLCLSARGNKNTCCEAAARNPIAAPLDFLSLSTLTKLNEATLCLFGLETAASGSPNEH